MAHEIPAGQSMLLIKRDAYERANLTRAAIDERLNLTADEFTVDGGLIMIGPIPDGKGFVYTTERMSTNAAIVEVRCTE